MDDCDIPWGYDTPKGYKRQNNILMHRKAWEEKFGPIPKGMMVLHKCDNRPCRNVDHLKLGTNQDNMDDMKARNRYGKRAKLTPEKVQTIRKLYFDGYFNIIELADMFEVTDANISLIINRKRWSHVA